MTVLAQQTGTAELDRGCLYPPLAQIREVSLRIAEGVADLVFTRRLTRRPRPADLLGWLRTQVYEPVYHSYV